MQLLQRLILLQSNWQASNAVSWIERKAGVCLSLYQRQNTFSHTVATLSQSAFLRNADIRIGLI